MNFFNYLYYRMYKAYLSKKDDPKENAWVYIGLIYLMLLFCIGLFVEKMLLLAFPEDYSTIRVFFSSRWTWGITTGVIALLSYNYHSLRDISYYEDKFAGHHWLNKNVKIWMLILLPFVMVGVVISIHIFLFGGKILGHSVRGLFPPAHGG